MHTSIHCGLLLQCSVVSLSVLVMAVSPAKTGVPIEMSFALCTCVGSRNHIWAGSPTGMGTHVLVIFGHTRGQCLQPFSQGAALMWPP